MAIYDELGIPRVINGNATLTSLGGSVLAPGVAEAMAEAGTAFVDLVDLQRAVGAEIARLTHNEACYVSCGAAAGLTLVTAACIAGTDPEKRERLPFTEGLKNEVVVHGHTRVGYDFAIRMAGVRLVEIGSRAGTSPGELEAVLSPHTAAMFYFPRGAEERGELPLEIAVEICHARGVPVIVDAAAQLPPKSNLWTFTQRGADAAIFSGGKGLRGPQSTGLVLGKQALIQACAFHGPPYPYIGRGMKVGKEELCGILAAVRWYLAQDEDAQSAFCERVVAEVAHAFEGRSDIRVRGIWPSEAGQPVPRAELDLDEAALGRTRDEILAALRSGTPAVDLARGAGATILVNPQTLAPEEVTMIVQRLCEELAPRSRHFGS
ncbi:MAG: aminotransferase class V-fold PLP-dependent enzyme [Armatimonadetes bacterium]|nr:aminotransferase class V-fold PLP-dependent enzyme [Armatimonadota bacterium]